MQYVTVTKNYSSSMVPKKKLHVIQGIVQATDSAVAGTEPEIMAEDIKGLLEVIEEMSEATQVHLRRPNSIGTTVR